MVRARVTREVDAGPEALQIDFPAVITTDLRLNEPRYASLPDIMKAKKKTLDTVALTDLDVTIRAAFAVSYESPPARQKGIMVKDVTELVVVRNQ